jgi:DNA repair exonuclease SbcCD ATPase subunit
MRVRKENYDHRKVETERRIEELQKSIPSLQGEIENLKKESPLMAKKAEELKKKKEELSHIQEERKKLLTLKSELNSIKERIKDKERQLSRVIAESEHTLKSLEDYARSFVFKDEKECSEAVEENKKLMTVKRTRVNEINQTELTLERVISVSKSEIERNDKIKSQVEKIDTCPLCQSKITDEHIKHVFLEADNIINKCKQDYENSIRELESLKQERRKLLDELRDIDDKKSKAEMEHVRHKTAADKQEYIKKLVADEKGIKQEIASLDEKEKDLRK